MQATLVYEYTEHKSVKGRFVAFEYWSVISENKKTSLTIEIDFEKEPLLKVGDKYVNQALYNEFEVLCVCPTLYRQPEKLDDFIAKCTK